MDQVSKLDLDIPLSSLILCAYLNIQGESDIEDATQVRQLMLLMELIESS